METNAYSIGTLNLFDFSHRSPSSVPLLIVAAILLLLALVSVTGAEVAFLSLSNSYKAYFEKDKSKKAKTLLRLLTDPEKLMATLVVANVFLKTGFFVVSFFLTFSLLQSITLVSWATVIFSIFAILLIILCSELIPKTYAVAEPKNIC